MTTRRPLVVIAGDLQEIPIGDAVASDLLLPASDAVAALAFFLGG